MYMMMSGMEHKLPEDVYFWLYDWTKQWAQPRYSYAE